MRKDPAILALQCRRAYEGLDHKERRFVDLYAGSLRIGAAATESGYANVQVGTKLMARPYVAMAVAHAMDEKSKLARIDASWALRKLALIAAFNIKSFIIVGDDGRPYYDFRAATEEDWYCIDEITVEALRARADGEQRVYVDSVKIKSLAKLKALDMILRHTDVQGYREKALDEGTKQVTQVQRTIVRRDDTPAEPRKISGVTG